MNNVEIRRVTDKADLVIDTTPLSPERCLDMLLGVLNEWCFSLPGEERDHKLGHAVWALINARNPERPTDEEIEQAEKLIRSREEA